MNVSLPRAALCLAALTSALGGCRAVEDTARASQAIAGGVADTTHTNVMGIAIVRNGGFGTCTGSLITPTLVLTARHCVSPVTEGGVLCTPAVVNGVRRAATVSEEPYAPVSFYVTPDAVISPRSRFTGVFAGGRALFLWSHSAYSGRWHTASMLLPSGSITKAP